MHLAVDKRKVEGGRVGLALQWLKRTITLKKSKYICNFEFSDDSHDTSTEITWLINKNMLIYLPDDGKKAKIKGYDFCSQI